MYKKIKSERNFGKFNSTNIVVDKETFEHFLKGDGEVYYDYNEHKFLSKAKVEKLLTDKNLVDEDDQEIFLAENCITVSYDFLADWLECQAEDLGGAYGLDYLVFDTFILMRITMNELDLNYDDGILNTVVEKGVETI